MSHFFFSTDVLSFSKKMPEKDRTDVTGVSKALNNKLSSLSKDMFVAVVEEITDFALRVTDQLENDNGTDNQLYVSILIHHLFSEK